MGTIRSVIAVLVGRIRAPYLHPEAHCFKKCSVKATPRNGVNPCEGSQKQNGSFQDKRVAVQPKRVSRKNLRGGRGRTSVTLACRNRTPTVTE